MLEIFVIKNEIENGHIGTLDKKFIRLTEGRETQWRDSSGGQQQQQQHSPQKSNM